MVLEWVPFKIVSPALHSKWQLLLKIEISSIVHCCILNGVGAVGHNFEMRLPKDYPCQVWFNLVQWFQRKRFKCDLLSKYASLLHDNE
jgi:hypothetical protein